MAISPASGRPSIATSDQRPGRLGAPAKPVVAILSARGRPLIATSDLTSTRRNVLTRGIDVNALVGRNDLIGNVRCRGLRLAEPCARRERLSGPGLLRPLIHRGGLRADILDDGDLRLGAAIRAEEPADAEAAQGQRQLPVLRRRSVRTWRRCPSCGR